MNAVRAARWERRPDAREAELLHSALHVFAELGYRGTSIDTVAARAGVTKGTVYHYFRNKEALLRGVIDHYQALAFERIAGILNDKTLTERDRLTGIVRETFTSRGETARPLLNVLIRTLPIELPRVHEAWLRDGPARLSAIIAGVIAAGQRRREFNRTLHAGGVARQLVAGLLLQFMWAPHGNSIRGLAVDEAQIVHRALEATLAALRP